MKRRNLDNAKLRRTLKKNKYSDGLCGSSLIYFKLLAIWAFVMIADFFLEFRFEYLWPFWLLLRSIYDSFRYQGVAFSVFFVCVTVTSDMICFIFIPVQWLFFLASTYVWVQYVWHADRGVCLPTVLLWLIFIYVEASIRLKELKSVPFTLDLCRPFAAHCIGYPVVTLGVGVKSYVSYRLRLRKQREVARINDFYTQLLVEALPAEQRVDGNAEKYKYFTNQSSDDVYSNGTVCNSQQQSYNNGGSAACFNSNGVAATTASRHSAKSSNSASSLPKKSSVSCSSPSTCYGVNASSAQRHQTNGALANGSSSNGGGVGFGPYINGAEADDDEEETDEVGMSSTSWWFSFIKAKVFGVYFGGGSTSSAPLESSGFVNSSPCSWSSSSAINRDSDDDSRASKDSRDSGTVLSNDCQLVKRLNSSVGKHKQRRRGAALSNLMNGVASSNVLTASHQAPDLLVSKDLNVPQSLQEQKEKVVDKDLHLSLELDIEKLQLELKVSRTREQELRSQIQQLTIADKSVKNELQQLRQNNEQLQTRVQNLVRARQQDKQNIATIEKKFAEEQKQKTVVEQQLQLERKQKKAEEATRTAAASKSECTETCKQRRRELEAQLKQVRRDLQQRDEQLTHLENEIRALRQFKEQNSADILMSALSAMQDKNAHLEASLSAETRIKLDLFSALGEAKRQLEISQNQLLRKEQDMDELRRKFSDMSASSAMYMNTGNNSVNVVTPLTPPPSTGSALDANSLDLLGTAAYQTASYMSNLPGLIFDDSSLTTDYNTLSMMTSGHVQSNDASLRFSPPRNTSH